MRLFREAAEAAEADGDTDRAAAAYARSVEIGARMHGIAGDPPVAELKVMLERGHELASDDDLVTRARLRLDDAWLAWMSKDPVAMAIPAEEGLELARRTDDRQLVQNALDAITASEWLQGRQLDAVEHTRERLDLLESAPRSHALDVEISDALHMMVLCLVQVGEFREALMYAKRGAEVDRSRGVEMAEYQRELMPNFLLGNWDRAIELGKSARRAWDESGQPPMGAFATPAACTAAAYGYRGDEAAAEDWMSHAYNLSSKDREQKCGVVMHGIDLELHRGRLGEAVALGAESVTGSQWTATYACSRAEAFVRAGREDAEDAIHWAEPRVGQDRYARAILLRAKGLHGSDESLLRESKARFEEMECPYQAARTGWLLGGSDREQAKRDLRAPRRDAAGRLAERSRTQLAPSAARRRPTSVSSRPQATSGCSSTNGLNSQADIPRQRRSVPAMIVAERGPLSISATSPKCSPGPRVRTMLPPTLTVALPSSITKKPIPLSPSRVISSPSLKSRSVIRLLSFFSSLGLMPENSGTRASVSSISAMRRRSYSPTRLDTRSER